jgi:hypothetical protein
LRVGEAAEILGDFGPMACTGERKVLLVVESFVLCDALVNEGLDVVRRPLGERLEKSAGHRGGA